MSLFTAADTLLASLDQHRARAVLFLTGANVDDATGKATLQRWNDVGHYVANHTYEHRLAGASSTIFVATSPAKATASEENNPLGFGNAPDNSREGAQPK